jgi:hypothetical protein
MCIPDWMAGEWSCEKQVVHSVRDCALGVNLNVEKTVRPNVPSIIYGQQQDKAGAIWHFIGTPRVQESRLGKLKAAVFVGRVVDSEIVSNNKAYKVYSKTTPLPADAGVFALNDSFANLEVNRQERILSVRQVEQINTYFAPAADGEMQVAQSVKSFDVEGRPMEEQISDAFCLKAAPFRIIDNQNGLDLHRLFIEFLKSTGQEALCP